MRHSTLLSLCLCVGGVLPQVGKAEPQASTSFSTTAQVVVAVLPPGTSKEVSVEERARIGDAVWAALDRKGVRRVAEADRDAILSGEKDLRACLPQPRCQERLGRLLAATHVLRVSLTQTAPSAYSTKLQVFDVEVGEIAAERSASCTQCTASEMLPRIDGLLEEAVVEASTRPKATLYIRSTPPNADVRIDGNEVGFTDLERQVFAGRHDIVVSLSRLGLAPEFMRITVAKDQRLSLSFVPRPAEKPLALSKDNKGTQRETAGRSRWPLALGIPLTVVGLGALSLGAASLALDGRCVGQGPPCPTIYDTLVPGAVEVAIGVALSATGAGLIFYDLRKRRQTKE